MDNLETLAALAMHVQNTGHTKKITTQHRKLKG